MVIGIEPVEPALWCTSFQGTLGSRQVGGGGANRYNPIELVITLL